MDYRYFYITWSLLFFLIWLFLFLRRKDLHTEMFFISTIFGLGGALSQKVFIQDWWKPETITGTHVGIEDFVIGFSIAGIAAVLYEEIYRLHFRDNSRTKDSRHGRLFLFSFVIVFLSLFYVLKLSSFYSAIFAYIAGISYISFYRKDLIWDSIASGVSMLVIGSVVYWGLFLIYPDYIQKFWYLKSNWYSTLFAGVPIAEYIWFFLTGAFIGPLYEFVRGKKLFHY